jgi:hypothetical protein
MGKRVPRLSLRSPHPRLRSYCKPLSGSQTDQTGAGFQEVTGTCCSTLSISASPSSAAVIQHAEDLTLTGAGVMHEGATKTWNLSPPQNLFWIQRQPHPFQRFSFLSWL